MKSPPSIEQNYEVFVRTHATAIVAYCMRRVSHADAHDAAAETFATAWRRWDRVPDGDDGRYWLLGVARLVLANQDRSRRRRLRLGQRLGSLAQLDTGSPETVVLRSAENQEVIDALEQLPRRDREVLALIVWDEAPRDRVAAMLGISTEAVNKRYQRALQRFERTIATQTERGTTTPSASDEGRNP